MKAYIVEGVKECDGFSLFLGGGGAEYKLTQY